MLKTLVEARLGRVIDEVQANVLANLAREWLWWPHDTPTVPGLAAELLASGFSTDKMALLAGLSRHDDRREIQEAFNGAMTELGLDWYSTDRRRDAELRCALCCEVIRRRAVRPTVGAQYFAHSYFYDLREDPGAVYLPLVGLVVELEESDVSSQCRFDRFILEYLDKKDLGGD
ncbi:hypothetical protein B7R22_09690 [Subtercola boreus]|uniref:Uncharacterized protein n=1 Tax=Subtercola boreus TaxID=120213 RepID=A0A3E0W0A4_9MICO|nr:hypothetical protein [Subtercola boreus]RFA14487.1 hypothetical protein B7R22_09690 [Subtercola boreus]